MDNNNKNNYDDFFKNEGNSNASASGNKAETNNGTKSDYNAINEQRGQSQQEVYGQSPYSNPNEPNRNQSASVQDAEYTPVNSESTSYGSSTVQSQDDTMYYYTYGNGRPPAQDQTNAISQNQTNSTSTYQQATYGNQTTTPVYNEQAQVGTNYRPFTTSQVGGNDPFGSKKEKNPNGFGKIFLSFMAGVIAVGLLMYTADVQNWFSQEVTVSKQTTSMNNGSSDSSKTTTSEKGSTASTSTPLADRPNNIASLFASASPAVVKIETYSSYSSGGGGSSSLLDDPFFRQFFGDNIPKSNGGGSGSSSDLQQTGMGTGFFFDETGYLLTNQHVVGDADEIRVVVEGYEKPFVAELLGSSYELDLAVLKIKGDEKFPTLPLGSSEDIKIGDWVIAIGNPYGFDHTLTVGVLSAKERPIDISDTEGTRNYENLLQTDASINPGNSGGPLLNTDGEVIGINTAVSSTAQGIGFAIPTSTINEVLESLKNNTAIPKPASPFIGADLQNLTEDIAKELGLSTTEGAIVRSVYYNSPAYVGDLKQFDVITGVDNETIKTMTELITYIQSKEVGETIELQIIRNNKEMSLSITIGDKNEFGLK
ncbi:MAG: trypsin-like peptidase domain-containing protein [Candidatus Pristimantibacillus lignocellulolyticus]|uniref:Trypsin-like peptidase domain-containing protein n=1 Tax=Candidatus Pristimantibacillus lignocellulolyticus TaxID=2994561 RepID=A0A9J6ZF01_9BACL|nr:MAG: trypsin-like peptidase domain-containing protein [Candidatus Pristimantibacillus lignocellulolyticus]